jgi:glycosyltransferase involved in cell wall biosynthesis
MYDVVVLVRNEIDSDPRVNKTVRSLASSLKNKKIIVDCFVNTIEKPEYEVKDMGCCNAFEVNRFTSGVTNAQKVMKKQGEIAPTSKKIDRTSLAFFYIVYLNLKFFWMCRKQEAKLYYANDLDTLLCGFLLSLRYNSKLVYDSHELFGEMYSDYTPMLKRLFFILEWYLIRRCDLVITVNDSIANELASRYAIEKPKVVMNCPEYTGIGRTVQPAERIKNAVIYVGSYQEERRLEDLVMSMKYTNKFKLYLMGWGSLESTLRNIVEKNNIQDRVVFKEPVPMEQIISVLTNYKFGIIPYVACSLNNKYSTPNKFFEYMHAGVIPIYPYRELEEIERIMTGVGLDTGINMSTPENIARELDAWIKLYNDDGYEHIYRILITSAETEYNWKKQFETVRDFFVRNI